MVKADILTQLKQQRQQIGAYKENIKLAKQQAELEKKKAQEAKQYYESIETPRRSLKYQQQHKEKVLSGRIERDIKIREQTKREGLQQVQQAEQELGAFESQLSEAERQAEQAERQIRQSESYARDYSIAEKAVGSKSGALGLENKRQIDIYQKLKRGLKQRQQAEAQLKAYKQLGITPQYKGGKIVGYADEKLGMSYEVPKLSSVRPESLQPLSDVGAIEIQKVEEAPSMSYLPQKVMSRETPKGIDYFYNYQNYAQSKKPIKEKPIGYIQGKIYKVKEKVEGYDEFVSSKLWSAEAQEKHVRKYSPLFLSSLPSSAIIEGFRLFNPEIAKKAKKAQVDVVVDVAEDYRKKPVSNIGSDIIITASTFGIGTAGKWGSKLIKPLLKSSKAIVKTGEVGGKYKTILKVKDVARFGKLAGYGVGSAFVIGYGASAIKDISIAGTPREKAKVTAFVTKDIILGVAGYKLGQKAVDYSFEPVRIKLERPTNIKYVAESEVLNLRRGGNILDVANYGVYGLKKPRRAFYVTRLQQFKQSIVSSERLPKNKMHKTYGYDDLSIEKLQRIYPKGKIIEVEPTTLGVAKTEPFVIKQGKIAGSLRGTKGVGVFTSSASARVSKGKIKVRQGKTIISRIEGEMEGDATEIRKVKPELLDAQTRKAFEEAGKGEIFKPEAKVERGSVKTTDILEIGKKRGIKTNVKTKLLSGDEITTTITEKGVKKAKIKPYGKRVQRGELVSIQESKYLQQNEAGEFGIKEFEILGEKIGVVDVTKPRVPKMKKSGAFFNLSPKKVSVIKAKTTRYEVELPEQREPFGFIKGIKPQRTKAQQKSLDARTLLQQKQQTKELVTKQVAGATLKISKTLKPKVRTPSSFAKSSTSNANVYNILYGGTATAQSQFYGKGIYELTESVGRLPSQFRPTITSNAIRESYREINIGMNRELIKTIPREITKEINKESTKLIPKEIVRSVPKEVIREVPREIIKVIPKETTKLVPKLTTKQIIRTPPKSPFFKYPKAPPITGKPPKIPIPRIGMGSKSKEKRIKIFGKTSYQPSFAAEVIGIYSKKKPLPIKGESYSPGFRPIILKRTTTLKKLWKRRKRKKN